MLSKIAQRILNKHSLHQQLLKSASNTKQVQKGGSAGGERFHEQYKTPDLTQYAYVEYKKYPTHITHNDPKSPDYIASERDDFNLKEATDSYNYHIERIKKNLEMQKQVHEILRKMDRPYLRGLPGVHRNISAGLQNYGKTPDIGFDRGNEDTGNSILKVKGKNENRWVDDTVYYPKYLKMSNEIEWQKELDTRPVNKHFNHSKGYKYDVQVPYASRYDYNADRLGHPEILGTPFERLLRLEGEIYHPNYLNQPFVKMPSPQPHDSLNFEEGEVVYENTKLLEWAKFWNYTAVIGYLWCAYFVPYQLIFKTHMPMEHAGDNLFWPYFQRTWFNWDNNAIHVPVVSLVALYASYIACSYIHNSWQDYVVKMQYSKDRELLFVTRVSAFSSTMEEVYEVAHLERLPPSVLSGVQHLSAQDDDGLLDVTCLNTQRNLVFYNEAKYWNPNVKSDFLSRVTNLWTKDYTGLNREEAVERDIITRPKYD